ncbi:MAG: metalloregulator ArsR/SmtB family transcription factor [Candidatus Aminicenantes bacterium]|nr:metalloregulator ArsR/SmtB family transcription factor [Candidatus Aminicenantes bacterium]
MKKRCTRVAAILKTLAHPQRLFILCTLIRGEAAVGELQRECGASQSLISQHLTRMRREGIVQARRSGNFVRYRVADPKLSELIMNMERIFNE